MIASIDLNDHYMVASQGDNSIQSCGFALIENSLVLGLQARDQSRLFPKEINNLYWKELNQLPLKHPKKLASEVRSHADLCWHQLKNFSEQLSVDSAIVVPPAHYSDEQLSLLLGITESLKISVSSLVNRPLLLSVANGYQETHRSVELQLHQTVLTDINVENHIATLGESEILSGIGILDIYDHLARYIQRLFINTTRFDPLHDAKTEQLVYDSIPNWLEATRKQSSIKIEVSHAGNVYHSTLSSEDVRNATQEPITALLNAIGNDTKKIVVSRLIKQLLELHTNDLSNMLQNDLSAHEACEKLANQLTHHQNAGYIETLYFVPEDGETNQNANAGTYDDIGLKISTPPITNDTDTDAAGAISIATHLLVGTTAWSGKFSLTLSDQGFVASREQPKFVLAKLNFDPSLGMIFTPSSNDFMCNGQAVHQPITLHAGDTIEYLPASTSMQAIMLNNDDTETA